MRAGPIWMGLAICSLRNFTHTHTRGHRCPSLPPHSAYAIHTSCPFPCWNLHRLARVASCFEVDLLTDGITHVHRESNPRALSATPVVDGARQRIGRARDRPTQPPGGEVLLCLGAILDPSLGPKRCPRIPHHLCRPRHRSAQEHWPEHQGRAGRQCAHHPPACPQCRPVADPRHAGVLVHAHQRPW